MEGFLWKEGERPAGLARSLLGEVLQWELGHKKPSTRNPTLESQGSYRFVVWEPMAFHGKTLRNEETQGTLEGSRVFLGMGSHCRQA